MKRDAGAPILSAIFVDYDNIYLSLKRKSEDAAKRFSKNALGWLRGLESGQLLTLSGGGRVTETRRVVMNRCYGNPVPRRNQADNSTDMNSFPFVRHHFLRAGFEVVDCPPLTAQMKNSADIRMVMDMRDLLTHPTHFDEFIILSGDADFTPVLHRLRQHARRTFVYANDYTAAPYTAIADGEIREADLIALLLADAAAEQGQVATLTVAPQPQPQPPSPAQPALRLEDLRYMIIAEVVSAVRASAGPVPLEALADRALRALGHDRTVGTNWAGAGSFRELLRLGLPADVRLSENPPFFAYDPARHLMQPATAEPPRQLRADVAPPLAVRPAVQPAEAGYYDERPAAPAPAPLAYAPAAPSPLRSAVARAAAAMAPAAEYSVPAESPAPSAARARPAPPPVAAPARVDGPTPVQRSIARIHEACQAPPLAPQEYRALFEVMAAEIAENGLAGVQTLNAIAERAEGRGLTLRRDDVRFVLEVISEADPWFEQGASANLFGGRFRNYVVARCRDQGLELSAEELDLIDAWFAGAPAAATPARAIEPPKPAAAARSAPAEAAPASRAGRWWASGDTAAAERPAPAEEDFPRIIRSRRG